MNLPAKTQEIELQVIFLHVIDWTNLLRTGNPLPKNDRARIFPQPKSERIFVNSSSLIHCVLHAV